MVKVEPSQTWAIGTHEQTLLVNSVGETRATCTYQGETVEVPLSRFEQWEIVAPSGMVTVEEEHGERAE